MSDRLGSLVTPELLEVLDTLFPERCIRPGMSLEEAHREAGTRQVVEKLKAAYDEYTADLQVLDH
jgi:hypothetical protein